MRRVMWRLVDEPLGWCRSNSVVRQVLAHRGLDGNQAGACREQRVEVVDLRRGVGALGVEQLDQGDAAAAVRGLGGANDGLGAFEVTRFERLAQALRRLKAD